jgi:hypothetical protein
VFLVEVALGASHQVVNIQGSTTETGTGSANPGTFPGGFFAQSTNVGRRTDDQFGVIPQLQVQFGYQVTSWLRAFVGYDFLYWNQVVRPGSQIDRRVNATQQLFLGESLIGTPLPAPLFDRTDFWVQGVSFGAELRY